MRTIVPVLSLLLLITGCTSSVGKNFDEAQLEKIHKGASTKRDLVALFGHPTSETPYPEDRLILLWTWAQARTLDTTEGKTLTVELDKGRVKSYTVSKS
ncbi:MULTISPECIES: hypothetical protein [Erwinia]|uniref:hypothetical protein n=1 Tax=Erwinia TaxID=551 RepID=UPI00054E5A1B|nr:MULTISPECIES: hypothetical protein [Erwinia]